jgi:hypothetical protein
MTKFRVNLVMLKHARFQWRRNERETCCSILWRLREMDLDKMAWCGAGGQSVQGIA